MSFWSAVIFAVVWFILFTFMLGGISSAPWVPTRRREAEALAKEVLVKAGQRVHDLGCGDGSMLFALADRQADARYVGHEIAVLPWLVGLVRNALRGARGRNVSLRYGDLFGVDLSDADIVTVFLLRKSYPKLLEKFSRELRDDARVVVEAWALPGVAHDRVTRTTSDDLPLYFYTGAAIKAARHSV